MNFLATSIESLGAKVTGWFTVGYGMFAFLAQAGLLLLDRTTWNRATIDGGVKQVYFTAVQILHVFLGYALVISWLINHHHPIHRTRFRPHCIRQRNDHSRAGARTAALPDRTLCRPAFRQRDQHRSGADAGQQ